jgi:hypothetical protein
MASRYVIICAESFWRPAKRPGPSEAYGNDREDRLKIPESASAREIFRLGDNDSLA